MSLQDWAAIAEILSGCAIVYGVLKWFGTVGHLRSRWTVRITARCRHRTSSTFETSCQSGCQVGCRRRLLRKLGIEPDESKAYQQWIESKSHL